MRRLVRLIAKRRKFAILSFSVAILILTGTVVGMTINGTDSPVAPSDTSTLVHEPSSDIVIVPPTTPITTPDERTSLPSKTATPKTTDNAAACSAIIAEYQPQLDSLQTKIQEQLDIMRNIQVSLDLNPGDMLHQADMMQKFNAANAKAKEFTAQYGSLKQSYQSELLGAGCTDALKQLLY